MEKQDTTKKTTSRTKIHQEILLPNQLPGTHRHGQYDVARTLWLAKDSIIKLHVSEGLRPGTISWQPSKYAVG